MIGKVDVVVLAGGGSLKADSPAGRKKASPPAARGNKALLNIGGRPMIDYVIEARGVVRKSAGSSWWEMPHCRKPTVSHRVC